MKNKKGFTLVELLAVIVILGLLAVLIVPKVTETLKKSRININQSSVSGLQRVADNFYMGKKIDGSFSGCLYDFTNNVNTCEGIEFTGEKPEKGVLSIDKNGDVLIAVKFDNLCYYKSNNSDEVISQDYNEQTCNEYLFAPDPVSFETDSWATIKKAINSDNTGLYNIGDTKDIDIDLDGDGTISATESFTVRLSNKTYDGCDTVENGFSQTACGFVFEFVDTIGDYNMNSSLTNEGGWPVSDMYTYLNSNIYSKLSSDLQSVIADTYTVSGHGSTEGETNFTSTSKLYLLSKKEVFGDNDDNLGDDTASGNTKRLKYYQDNTGVSSRIKYTTGSTSTASTWWLRTAHSNSISYFYNVRNDGNGFINNSNVSLGVAPAFRIVKNGTN